MERKAHNKLITNNKFWRNLSWIFVGNVIHAVLLFLVNIYVARKLSTDSYGLLSYAASLIAFFTSICTLGLNGIITKKFAENETAASSYIGTAIVLRIISAIFAIISLQIIVHYVNPGEPYLALIVLCQSISIIFGSFDLFMYWFQYKHQARTVAVLRFLAAGISVIWRIAVVSVSGNLIAYAAGVAIETVLFGIFLAYTYVKKYDRHFSFSKEKAVAMLRISYPFIFSALLSTIYWQTDKIMLKSFLNNTAVAQYAISFTLAGAITIIPSALIEGFRPDIMKYKLSDEKFYQKRLRQLYSLVFWICIVYGVFISLFSEQIILLLYGEKYIAAVPALSLIVWYTSFTCCGAINNLYMIAENKTKWVQIITLFGATLNVLLNLLLIPQMGIVGAALASLITQICAHIILIAIIPSLRGCSRIMLDGLLLRNIITYKSKKIS